MQIRSPNPDSLGSLLFLAHGFAAIYPSFLSLDINLRALERDHFGGDWRI